MKPYFAADDVQAHADKLTGPHLAILAEALVLGSRYEDIAVKLGLNLGTVKSRLHRARAALDKLLAAAAHKATPPGFDKEGSTNA